LINSNSGDGQNPTSHNRLFIAL